jgi:hypothetical protein
MKKVTVNWNELSAAFDNSRLELRYFLDTDTGQVLMVTAEDYSYLQELYEETQEEASGAFDLDLALAESGLPDWQQEGVRTADFIEIHFGGRIIAIPEADTRAGYDAMQAFIATVENRRLQNQLVQATHGRGAFRRFRNILSQHLAEEQRWYAFEENRLRQQIADWLTEEGIEPINDPELVAVDEAAFVELRNRLLDEVALFVQATSQIPGVRRIALIGSLTSDKPDPKDADILVTVTDTLDLARLAEQGRKLKGHCQSFNRGGEVFLADEQNRYLGRICPWKRCEPYIRAACQAQNCGQRPFLHDDLHVIKLPAHLFAAPPLILWPELVASVAVPEDVVARFQPGEKDSER